MLVGAASGVVLKASVGDGATTDADDSACVGVGVGVKFGGATGLSIATVGALPCAAFRMPTGCPGDWLLLLTSPSFLGVVLRCLFTGGLSSSNESLLSVLLSASSSVFSLSVLVLLFVGFLFC